MTSARSPAVSSDHCLPSSRVLAPGIELGDQLGDRPRLVGGRVEPGVVDLQEDPLRPLVEVDVGGGEAAAGVVTEPQPAELAAEVDDVGLGAGARMGAGLHGVLLGGQPERVEAQRVQHVAAVHPEVAGVDVGGDVAQRVPDVQSLARRVREHVLDEHLVGRNRATVGRRQRADRVGHVERARAGPRSACQVALDRARPAPRCSGAAGRRRPGRWPSRSGVAFRSRQQGIRARRTAGSDRSHSGHGWSRFRCRPVSAWFQVDSSPGGSRSRQWLQSAPDEG